MSHVVDHVDEAQLHAYLDRDLEFADPAVRQAVGAHIADCSKCSALLKEVRQVYKAANQLLDVATPPARSGPSFEDIVKRAAARQDNGSEADSQRSRFLRGHEQTDRDATGDFEIDIESVIDDAVENDLLSMLQANNASSEERRDPEAVPDNHQPVAEDDVIFKAEDTAEDAKESVEEIDELLTAATDDDADVSDEKPSLVVDEQSEVQELAIPSEDEIVFIEADSPVASERDEPDIVSEVAGPPSPQEESAHKPTKRRGTRILALAATILVTVGIGGWFGRPYLMARFSDAPVIVAVSESVGENTAAPSRADIRQERSGVTEPNAPGDTPLLAADVLPGPINDAGEGDRLEPTGGFADAELQGKASDATASVASALSDTQRAASQIDGRTILGSVRDATSKRAITGARVAVAGTDRVALTDSDGRYQIANVPAGSVSVDVIGIGYRSTEIGLAVSENKETIADFELRRAEVSLDEMVVTDAEQTARAREAASNTPPSNAEVAWSVTPRLIAETLLGGPLVSIDGSRIERIERALNRAEIRITQTTRTGELVYIRIVSTGTIGDDATLEAVGVTSSEEQRPSTGTAKYGNYRITVRASVSGAELESLIRRITVTPEVN